MPKPFSVLQRSSACRAMLSAAPCARPAWWRSSSSQPPAATGSRAAATTHRAVAVGVAAAQRTGGAASAVIAAAQTAKTMAEVVLLRLAAVVLPHRHNAQSPGSEHLIPAAARRSTSCLVVSLRRNTQDINDISNAIVGGLNSLYFNHRPPPSAQLHHSPESAAPSAAQQRALTHIHACARRFHTRRRAPLLCMLLR